MLTRDEHIFAERIAGTKLRTLAERHDLTPEGVRLIAMREGRRHVERVALDLWAAMKAGELLALAVPAWASEADQRIALRYLEWLLSELPARGVVPRVHYRPTTSGAFAFALEDASFNPTVSTSGADT